MKIAVTVNGTKLRARRRTAHAARVFSARRLRADRYARRMRYVELRLLRRRARRRHGGQVVHDVRRQADGHEITTVEGLEQRRQAASAAAGLLGSARAAVRLLHARHADDVVRAAATEPESERTRNPRSALRESLPLHRLSEHRQSRAASLRRTRAPNPRPSPQGEISHDEAWPTTSAAASRDGQRR